MYVGTYYVFKTILVVWIMIATITCRREWIGENKN